VTPSPRSTGGPATVAGGGSGSGGPGAQPVLPVTGDDTVKLIALSLLMIGGGALTVRASRR
jgi:LPXTG-motif cell wall-anchored protein